jgi:hypothetical protein
VLIIFTSPSFSGSIVGHIDFYCKFVSSLLPTVSRVYIVPFMLQFLGSSDYASIILIHIHHISLLSGPPSHVFAPFCTFYVFLLRVTLEHDVFWCINLTPRSNLGGNLPPSSGC